MAAFEAAETDNAAASRAEAAAKAADAAKASAVDARRAADRTKEAAQAKAREAAATNAPLFRTDRAMYVPFVFGVVIVVALVCVCMPHEASQRMSLTIVDLGAVQV